MPRTPRPRPGDPIKAEHLIALADAIDRLQPSAGPGSGLSITSTPSGTSYVVRKPPPLILTKAITGAGGVPAGSNGGKTPGSATVTITTWSGSALVAGTETVTAYNFTTSAVGANKPVTIGWLESYSLWEVILEPC